MTRTGFEEWACPECEGGAEAGRITRAGFEKKWAWPQCVGGRRRRGQSTRAGSGSGRVQNAWAGLWLTVGVAKTLNGAVTYVGVAKLCGRDQKHKAERRLAVGVVKTQGRARENCGRDRLLRGVSEAWPKSLGWSRAWPNRKRSGGALWAWPIQVGVIV